MVETQYHIIFDCGKIYSKSLKRYLTQTVAANGYVVVWMVEGKIKRLEYTHRVVAKHFIPNPRNKKYVNHKNGIKTDNRMENLEWTTPSENLCHAFDIGIRTDFSDNHPKVKVSSENVLSIISEYENGNISQYALAKKHGVSQSLISRIVNKKRRTREIA